MLVDSLILIFILIQIIVCYYSIKLIGIEYKDRKLFDKIFILIIIVSGLWIPLMVVYFTYKNLKGTKDGV